MRRPGNATLIQRIRVAVLPPPLPVADHPLSPTATRSSASTTARTAALDVADGR
jgi:hypothetical protein